MSYYYLYNCSTNVIQLIAGLYMAKDAVLQIRIDSDLKEKVEVLYESLGISFADAVRMFAVQSLASNGLPFTPRSTVLLNNYPNSAGGILHNYANTSLIDKEKDAWALVVGEKYGLD